MKRLMIAGLLVLAGCAAAVPSETEVPLPASAVLVGGWGAADEQRRAEAGIDVSAEYAADAIEMSVDGEPYASAVADRRRPQAEVHRDPYRQPLAMLAFIGVQPGDRIADIRPEEGYFTRLFAPVVGPEGRVYAFVPTLTAGREQAFAEGLRDEYGNVTPVIGLLDEMTFDQPLDVVFTAQEYHDFHIDRFDTNVAEMNRRVFQALRPGGLYVILDHSGRPGTGNTEVATLHRIEGAFLRREVEAAGFVFEGETRVLANPDDDMTISVFDESIRGRTDQFVYRFRRPE